MNLADNNIKNFAEEVVTKNGFFVVDTIIRGTTSFKVIEVFIDSEGNVSAEDCAGISRELKVKLDSLLANESNYRLDVSSPGVDRPLKFLKQFPKHVNRNFEISYKSNNETKKISGKLLRVDGEELFFNNKGKETIVKFNTILKAKVIISFS